jgi:aspartate/methionine/tyrosine aminotransferase
MRIEREMLGDWFIHGREVGYEYSLTSVGRPPITLQDLNITFEQDKDLDWGGYYFGPPVLKQRIIETQQYDLPEANLFPTNGTYEANYLAVMATVERGDEVIIEAPAWTQVRALCKAIGAEIKTLPLRAENAWKPNPDELRELISPATKLVFINHPNNPTGSVLTEDDMQELCDVVGQHGSYLICDEIYRGLEWDGPLSPSVVNHYERGIATSSLTKTLGLCGLRLGWIASPDKDFLDLAFAIHRYAVMVTNLLGEILAAAALEPATFERLIEEGRTLGQRNRKITEDWIAENPLFEWVPPGGGFMSFPRFKLSVGSWDFCSQLLAEPYRTYLVPGIPYGEAFDHYVRLGFGSETPEVKRGLLQLQAFSEKVASDQAFRHDEPEIAP